MYFTQERLERICDELKEYTHRDYQEVKSFTFKEGDFKDGYQQNLDVSSWQIFDAKERWGGRDKHFWFRTELSIPETYAGKTVVFEVKTGREKEWDALNPQFLIYVNGKLVQGLDVNHREIILTENAVAGETYTIALDAYSGMKEGLVELNAGMSILEREVEKLFYNIKVPLDVAGLLDKDDKKSIDILNYLNEAANRVDLRKPFSDEFSASVKEANEYLNSEFYEKYCGCDDVIATCVGHTHIDVAWLWTVGQSREKTARSFSTVLNLMREYPEYIFMSSQPQLYKFIKEDYPELYEEIKERVKEGRWEAEGAMWLEADCNISSGESLVRQVLFGTRFFEKEFGVKNRILWLPDVFGYSAALPQILKKSGIDYFMTTKISWSEYNKLPYDTFMWRGMDGTEILTHFITTSDIKTVTKSHFTTYNGDLVPKQVMGAWQRYQQKDINNDVLISYGYGDGGGGPTKEMLENSKRLSKGIPGSPKVKQGTSLEYFKKLEGTVSGKKRLPKWVGELYLEYHRGTYTSMARNKKYNRKSEFMYQDAEMLSIINDAAAGAGSYPQEQLNAGWETILLNQFHDILPGSSIKEVYEDSLNDYKRVTAQGKQIIDDAISGIASRINLKEKAIVVFNQLAHDRSDVVEFPLPEGYNGVSITDASGMKIVSQVIEGGKVIFYAQNVPAKGYKVFYISKADSENENGGITVTSEGFSNKFFQIALDDSGRIASIYDVREKREVLKNGEKANVLQAFEDKPHNHDAWDINIYYQEKMWEISDVESIEVLESGPVRGCICLKRKFLDSILKQNIYVYNDIPRIDFATVVDWKEKQILLKAAFPVDVHSDKAAYEIQYGNVERPTHWNTSWDYARFEVCAHKWADLSEDGYGVSLLNDCKFGHDIKESVMRLTLLKSATHPNVDADREVHEFTYSLYPHKGGWKEAGTVQMAYELNCPMYTKVEDAHSGSLQEEFSMVGVDKDNVVIEVVKKAEDSEAIIVRLYECYNRRTTVTLSFFKEIAKAAECDLMEKELKDVQTKGNQITFEIKPYEIKTFKFRLK